MFFILLCFCSNRLDVRYISYARTSFQTQTIKKPRSRCVLLDLILSNKEELVRDVKIRDKFGCRDHEIVEIRILRGWNKAKSRTTTLEFWRSEFVLFRALIGRIPW